jgi:hypothetical protein
MRDVVADPIRARANGIVRLELAGARALTRRRLVADDRRAGVRFGVTAVARIRRPPVRVCVASFRSRARLANPR